MSGLEATDLGDEGGCWCVILRVRQEQVGRIEEVVGARGAVVEGLAEGNLVHVRVYCEDTALAQLVLSVADEEPLVGVGSARLERVTPDWQTAWVSELGPVEIVPGLVVTHTGRTALGEQATSTLYFEPALAFGFGDHATTRLAARWLTRGVSAIPASSVIDLGCGTGILSLVALRQGARLALGVDRDSKAVEAARRHAQLNGLSDRARFENVSIEDVCVAQPVDLVVCNVTLDVLCASAPRIATLGSPGGRVGLTGILRHQAEEAIAAYAASGLELRLEEAEDEWALLSGWYH